MKMSDRKLKWVALIILGVLIVWFLYPRPRSHFSINPGPSASTLPRSVEVPSSAPFGRAKDDQDSRLAFQVQQRAFGSLAKAKSYRKVSLTMDGGGHIVTVFITLYLNSNSRGPLHRCDIVNLDPKTGKPNDSGRTEISNESGNWEMRETPGAQEVTFLLKDGSIPVDTIGMRNAYVETAQSQMPPGQRFEQSRGRFSGQAAVTVRSSGGYCCYIDPSSGALLGTVMNMPPYTSEDHFVINPEIDETEFDIPADKILTPIVEIQRAADFLRSSVNEGLLRN